MAKPTIKKHLVKLASLNLLKLATATGSIDHRASILQAVTDKFGSVVSDELTTHGCWASKLDITNNAWNGGTLKVDSIDSYFSKWFSACACLERENAECANGLDSTCSAKLDEIETYYLNLIETEMPTTFSPDTSQACVHPDKSNSGSNGDNRGGHCQNIVPNYVEPPSSSNTPTTRSGCSFSARGIDVAGQGFEVVDCSGCPQTSNPVYGNLIYTVDSDICQAALFEGLITVDGSGNYQGSFTIYSKPGQSSYSSSSQNGVTTNSYTQFNAGSFCFSNTCLPVPTGDICDATTTTCESAGICAAENNRCCKAEIENCDICTVDGDCTKCSAGYDFNRFTGNCEAFGASPGGSCSNSQTCQTEDGTVTSCVGGVCCQAGVPADCELCVAHNFKTPNCGNSYSGVCTACPAGKVVSSDGMTCEDDVDNTSYYVGIALTPGNGVTSNTDGTEYEGYNNQQNKTSLWKLTARDGTTCTIPFYHYIIDFSSPQYGLDLDDSITSYGFCRMTMSQVQGGLKIEAWMPSETDYEAGNTWGRPTPYNYGIDYKMQELRGVQIALRSQEPTTALLAHSDNNEITCNHPDRMWFMDSGADSGATARQNSMARCQLGEFGSCDGRVSKFTCGRFGVCPSEFQDCFFQPYREKSDTTFRTYGYPSNNGQMLPDADNANQYVEYNHSYTNIQIMTAAGSVCNLVLDNRGDWNLNNYCYFPVYEFVNQTFTVTGSAVDQEGDDLYDDYAILRQSFIRFDHGHKFYEWYYSDTHPAGRDCEYCLRYSAPCDMSRVANILWDQSAAAKNYQFPHKTSAMRGCVGDSCEGGEWKLRCNTQRPANLALLYVHLRFVNFASTYDSRYNDLGPLTNSYYARGNSKIHMRVTTKAGSECYIENWREFMTANNELRYGYCYFPVDEVNEGDITVEYWQEGDKWEDVHYPFLEQARGNGVNASEGNMVDYITKVWLAWNDITQDSIQYDAYYGTPMDIECNHPDNVWFIDGDNSDADAPQCARGCCNGLNGPRCKHTCSPGIAMTNWVDPGQSCGSSNCSGMGCRNGICCASSVDESCSSCGGDGLCNDV